MSSQVAFTKEEPQRPFLRERVRLPDPLEPTLPEICLFIQDVAAISPELTSVFALRYECSSHLDQGRRDYFRLDVKKSAQPSDEGSDTSEADAEDGSTSFREPVSHLSCKKTKVAENFISDRQPSECSWRVSLSR